MKYFKWIAAAALVSGSTGCIDNSSYGTSYNRPYGYSTGYDGYGYANGQDSGSYYQQQTYYGQRPVNNYYVVPQPRQHVVTQPRYVAAPVTRSQRDRDNDHDAVSDRAERDRGHRESSDGRERN